MGAVPVYPKRWQIRKVGRWWDVYERGVWRATYGRWVDAVGLAANGRLVPTQEGPR